MCFFECYFLGAYLCCMKELFNNIDDWVRTQLVFGKKCKKYLPWLNRWACRNVNIVEWYDSENRSSKQI